MNLLITGGSGLLGSQIAKLGIAKGHAVYSCYVNNVPNYGFPVRMEIYNPKEVEKAFIVSQPDVVVHTAAISNVDFCEENRDIAYKTNVLGTKNVAEQSSTRGAFLIYVSTDYVFSGKKGLYKEEDATDPINYYGFTKSEGEKRIVENDKEWSIIRTSVIYGAKHSSGKTNFALWVIENLEAGKRINVITDQFVSPTLNTNLAEMILEILDRKLVGIYHLTGADRINRYDFAGLLADHFDLDKNLINPVTSEAMVWKAKRPEDTSLNVGKAMNILTNKPLELNVSIERLKREMLE